LAGAGLAVRRHRDRQRGGGQGTHCWPPGTGTEARAGPAPERRENKLTKLYIPKKHL